MPAELTAPLATFQSLTPPDALALVAAYLLGSVPFAVISSRLFGLADPRTYGSGNPGATNVLRSGNKAAAILTLLGDALKGWFAVWLAAYSGATPLLVGLVMLAVFFGHLFPIFLKFKGGKGVATAAGALLAVSPAIGLATLGVWLGIALVLRYSSLAAICAAVGAPLLTLWLHGADALTITVGVMALALIVKHRHNLQRLIAGTEPKIGGKKT
ncbi:glycerol-3-phosphate 1-O-acyltransferase PlsY [Rhodocyclus tenuis]|uniref:Glycerol-3-phosphate acyltransferase n=1 Tax=Rhodocyclus gracilis TaxID=2929842 RepID=A0ABX0WG67_9RHOO|nr:glycerol-3-phosphate 1-O-acyltransferase PlsY [Rhodocyclus gracilis]MRD72752.1 glycerol-3-phosphate 1-O-acyltransferase PlsY [Rhodocyclus gracilis]NJA88281.1 glycerol-3-phosphate 1-O-acyltransferase PlsY [Rhodocyclus gracilis]